MWPKYRSNTTSRPLIAASKSVPGTRMSSGGNKHIYPASTYSIRLSKVAGALYICYDRIPNHENQLARFIMADRRAKLCSKTPPARVLQLYLCCERGVLHRERTETLIAYPPAHLETKHAEAVFACSCVSCLYVGYLAKITV